MSSLPDAIQNLLGTLLESEQTPAYIRIDENVEIVQSGGDLQRYGIQKQDLAGSAEEILAILEGIIPLDEPVFKLTMVEVGEVPTDIIIQEEDGDHWVLFLDVTRQAKLQRLLQQKANDLDILQEKQVKLMSQLEIANDSLNRMNDELEDRVRERTSALMNSNKQLRKEMDERQKAEADLVQAQKMDAIGQLAGGIAHDFNNMMTVVIGYSEMTHAMLDDQSDLKEFVEEIFKAGQLAASVARQLLAFSRQEVVHPRKIDINESIRNLEKMLRRLIGSDINLILDLCDSPYPIWIDPGQVEQVVLNLIVNARDAMPDGGKICISTKNTRPKPDDKKDPIVADTSHILCIEVKDEGRGIDPKIRDRIFEPFFTTKGIGKGTGLGLAVVFGIVKQQNGWIELDSEPGNGTIFRVYFPESTGATADTVKDSYSTADLSTDRMKILVVEDDDMVLKFTIKILESNGCVVYPAKNGAAARAIIETEGDKLDLIMSDVVLSDSSGVTLVDQIRKTNPGFPALLTSGYTGSKAQWDKIQEKNYAFLHKPYTADSLITALLKAMIS